MGKISKAFEKVHATQKGDGAHETDSPDHQKIRDLSAAAKTHAVQTSGLEYLLENEKWDARLRMSTESHSQWFESFRRLRMSILYPPSGERPKTILVTSVVPHEGKGFVCANLGVAIARDMEHQALMVDCDFRKPSLTRLFGLSNETGLVDHLKDNVELSLLVRKTGQPKLFMLPSGKPPQNPSELLSSNRMKAFVRRLSAQDNNRILLFDSPPSLVASETNIMAKILDGVVLVVRHGASGKEHVKRFVDSIGPEKIIGLVYNAYPENMLESIIEKKTGYGYDYGGYYK